MAEYVKGKKKEAAALAVGLAVSFAVTALLLLLLAFLLLRLQPDAGKIQIGILATYAVSCFFGGILCAGKCERRKFLWGLLTGLLYFVVLFAVSGMSERAVQPEMTQGVTALVLCACGGMLGGMAAR